MKKYSQKNCRDKKGFEINIIRRFHCGECFFLSKRAIIEYSQVMEILTFEQK